MSKSEPTMMEHAEMQVRCGFCGAGTEEWCQTSTGRPAAYPHDARTDQVLTIFRLGMMYALDTALHSYAKPTPAQGRKALQEYRDTLHEVAMDRVGGEVRAGRER